MLWPAQPSLSTSLAHCCMGLFIKLVVEVCEDHVTGAWVKKITQTQVPVDTLELV